MAPMRESHGFTLIELMIGLVVMGIAMALAVPSYRTWIQNAKLRNGAESILNGLQLARSEAVSRNGSVQFRLDTGSAWTVCVWAGTGTNCGEIIQSRPVGAGSSAAVTVATDAGSAVIFNNLGRVVPASAGGAIVTAINVDISTAVLSAADSRNLRIVINGGNVRMCDPAASSPDSRAC